MAIRLATPDDGAKLWALCEEFLASQVALGGSDQRKVLAIGIAYGLEHGDAIVVAEQNGELIGFVAWCGLPNGADGEAVGLGTYVQPGHRRHGLSERMRDFAKRILRHNGYRYVTTGVLDRNIEGLASARASGGRIVGYVVEWRL